MSHFFNLFNEENSNFLWSTIASDKVQALALIAIENITEMKYYSEKKKKRFATAKIGHINLILK